MDASKLDVDALFKQYTIKEIQAIELQIKNEIEKKKEDLRIMVYNRYRDIIDAADGIHVMKNCSKQIETVLNELQSTSETLFSDKENSEFANQDKIRAIEKSKRNNKYVLAVIIKILQNSPSKIWYHLDNDEYLKAAKQYLIAQHSHVCLELEKSLKSQENSSSYIQYANELWNSIVFLTNTIVNKARAKLLNSTKNVSSRVLTDAISCIYLLENTSLKQLFQEYISTRTTIIGRVLESDNLDTNSSIKDRILECLKAFVNTVNCFYDLFSSETENKSQDFENIINDTTFTIEALKDDGIVVNKIPDYLKNVKFKDTDNVKRFDNDHLAYNCNQWLQSCLNELKLKLESVFKYATNLKSLVLIRDSVVEFETDLLKNPKNFISEFNQHLTWDYICNSLFKQKIGFWSELISSFYYSQSKLIIETSFKTTHENLIKNLHDCLNDKSFQNINDQKISPEMDINAFLWSFDAFNLINSDTSSSMKNSQNKSQFDFFSNQGSKLIRQQSSKSFNLAFKQQHSNTPAIQKLCKCLEEDFNRLLSDIEFSTNGSYLLNNEANIAILNDDFKYFNDYLQDNLQIFSDNLYKSLIEIIESLNNENSSEKVDSNDATDLSLNLNIKKILLICRLAHALPYNCPHLKICFNNLNQQFIQQRQQLSTNLKSTGADTLLTSLTKKKQNLTETKNLNDENWLKLLNKLSEVSKKGFKIWIDNICKDIGKKFFSKLIENFEKNEPENVLATNELIAWDEIEIEDELSINQNLTDETETTTKKPDSQSIKSKLSVPLVCSSLIQNVLYILCQQLTKNLSYTMIDSNLILKDLILSVFLLILDTYKNFLNKQIDIKQEDRKIKLTQNQSLQILFDIKFLYTLFDLKSFSSISSSSSDSNDKLNKLYNQILDDYKNVCSILESLIDPFDYDICIPFIQSNISKSISRSATLYGILSINDRHIRSLTNTSSSLTTSNEKFNLLVLSNSQHRFELLPIASQQPQQSQTPAQFQSMKLKNTVNLESKRTTNKSAAGDSSSASSGLFGFKWFQ